MNRLPRITGKTYVRCQHLTEKTQDTELLSISIGDTKRLIVCPVCARQFLGTAIDYLNQVYLNGIEFYKRHEEIEGNIANIIGGIE